jgi:anti-anti-sigma regulatory factor
VPAWRERGKRNPRVWSAGCASGEEAYTLALVLSRAMPRPDHGPTILASDVSAEAIAFARRGRYGAAALEHVPEPWRAGLQPCGDGVQVDPATASLVTFRQQNLADAELPRGFDLLWCRNVLIYFSPEARACTLAKLVDALEPGGFLFVGYSETLRDVAGLRAIRLADQVLWEKPLSPAAAPVSLALARATTQRSASSATSSTRAEQRTGFTTEARRARGSDTEGSPSVSGLRVPRASVVDPIAGRIPPAPGRGVSVVRVTATDAAALSAELGAALRAPGLSALTVDLDAATYLEDDAAPVLRRACAVASAGGIELSLRATRPGAKRWLRRNGFDGGEP